LFSLSFRELKNYSPKIYYKNAGKYSSQGGIVVFYLKEEGDRYTYLYSD
jgi:hypothetical protein